MSRPTAAEPSGRSTDPPTTAPGDRSDQPPGHDPPGHDPRGHDADSRSTDGHPRDGRGRILPDPAWPPGREAPGTLEFVRRFLNTRNRDNGADRLATPAGLAPFLAAQGRMPFTPDLSAHARLLALRELLHGIAVAHGDADPTPPDPAHTDPAHTDPAHTDPAPTDPAEHALADVVLGVHLDHGEPTVVAGGDGLTDRLRAELVVAVLAARAAGDWDRLKACRHCRWVVFDWSRNRSGRWCSMDVCGGRVNARAHRRRRRHDEPA